MSERDRLPPFEVVSVNDVSHAAAKRLRINVALSPEDASQASQVALEVINQHAADNDVVMIFFHYSAATADREAAAIRAQYVRHDMREDFRPQPITSRLGTIEVETPHGVITIENARNA